MLQGALPPITNRQSYEDVIEVFCATDDVDDGQLFDLTGCTAQVAIAAADRSPRGNFGGFGGYYYDGPFWPAPLLLASTADGSVTIPDFGTIVFNFTAAQIAALRPGQYVLAASITRDDATAVIVRADLTVLDGVFQ